MQTFTADADITLRFQFLQGTTPVLPDTNTAVYTLYGQDGLPVAGHVGEDVTVSTYFGTIELPSAVNEIETSFGKRTVVVTYEKSGAVYTIRISYRLVPFLNITVMPRDVRNFLGVNDSELPDDDIDLNRSYFAVREEVGSAVLATALASGELAETRANEAILYWAALDLLPSLQLRIAQQQADGPISFHRVSVRDFSKLETEARARLATALSTVSGRSETDYPLMITTNGADPITG